MKEDNEKHFYDLGKKMGKSERRNSTLIIGMSIGFILGFAICKICEHYNL